MLTCIPQSLCSRDFRVLGASAGSAAITFNFLTEQGGISLGHSEFTVRKHGPLSGHWTLERDGQTAADARKPSAMIRSFDVRVADVHFTVKAHSPFNRCYDILSGDKPVGVIQPAHAFTRRAFIKCSSEVPELAQLFSFWLAALTWRRDENSTNSVVAAQ